MSQRRGRPKLAPGEDSIFVGIKLPAGDLRRINATAKGMGMTRSGMMRNWLRLLIGEQEGGDADAKPVQVELWPAT